MAFITVSREFGSFGTTISQRAAQALQYDYIDKAVLEKVLDQYGLVTFHKFYDSPHSFWERLEDGNQEIIEVFNSAVLECAKADHAVFVGRAGFALLRGYDNVFHVLIKAPFDTRVANTMQTMRIADRAQAEELVRRHDISRESYLRTFYNASASDAGPFSLVADTSLIPPETAEQWIVEAARLLEQREIDPAKSTRSIRSDVVMQKTVGAVLHPE
jgi:cytidylate kinase